MEITQRETYGPTFRGPRLRWYSPLGLVALVLRSLWRFLVTGRPVWGRGDNATFLHDATVDHRGGPVERLSRARWRRVVWRWYVVGSVAIASVLATRVGAAAVAAYLFLHCVAWGYVLTKRLMEWWPQREVRRDYARPVWQIICKVVNERYTHRGAARMVQLPAGFPDIGEEEFSVRIHLPLVPLDEGVKKRIETSAAERLGITEHRAAWMVRGARAYVDISPKVFPPRRLVFAEVRELWEKASPVKPFLGLAASSTPVYADLDNDGPHVGVSGGTGTGKSTLMKVLLAKRVASGAGLVVCDYKVISHPWASRIAREDPSRVLYVTEEDEISEAILKVFAEFQRRRGILKTAPEELEFFRPIDLLVEELNSLASMLRKWWGHERKRLLQEAKDMDESAPYVPTVCPAVDAMGALVQMGRQLSIRVHFAGQRLDASALSPKDGGAIRESITNRFLAKYAKNTWRMLCDGVPFEVFPGGPRGIWTAVVNGVVSHFRVPLMTDDQAYALAMAGPAPEVGLFGGRLPSRPQRAVEQAVTLSEALPHLPRFTALEGLRTAVKRARSAGEVEPIGRRGNADVYDLGRLIFLWGEEARQGVTQ